MAVMLLAARCIYDVSINTSTIAESCIVINDDHSNDAFSILMDDIEPASKSDITNLFKIYLKCTAQIYLQTFRFIIIKTCRVYDRWAISRVNP